jgi:hypothetical protein
MLQLDANSRHTYRHIVNAYLKNVSLTSNPLREKERGRSIVQAILMEMLQS